MKGKINPRQGKKKKRNDSRMKIGKMENRKQQRISMKSKVGF